MKRSFLIFIIAACGLILVTGCQSTATTNPRASSLSLRGRRSRPTPVYDHQGQSDEHRHDVQDRDRQTRIGDSLRHHRPGDESRSAEAFSRGRRRPARGNYLRSFGEQRRGELGALQRLVTILFHLREVVGGNKGLEGWTH